MTRLRKPMLVGIDSFSEIIETYFALELDEKRAKDVIGFMRPWLSGYLKVVENRTGG